MKAVFSYACLVLGTCIGMFILPAEISRTPHGRVIAAYASRDIDFSPVPITGRAGSIDQLLDEGTGVHLVGWVNPYVDEVIFVPKEDGFNFVSRVNLIARSDVYSLIGTEDYLWSGLDISVPNLTLSSLKCVVYSDSTGATVMWSDGEQCK
jgi:hypothetical protein